MSEVHWRQNIVEYKCIGYMPPGTSVSGPTLTIYEYCNARPQPSRWGSSFRGGVRCPRWVGGGKCPVTGEYADCRRATILADLAAFRARRHRSPAAALAANEVAVFIAARCTTQYHSGITGPTV